MMTVNLDKIGARTALFVGLPFGTVFSLTVFVFSLFPMLDFGLAFIGGGLFWNPIIWAGLIPVTFIFLLWTAGNKIKTHLDKKYSVIQTSFLFTLFVNSWLFGVILIIFSVSGLFFSPLHTSGISNISLTAIGLTIFTYIISTVLTALTIGLLIVTITKNKIYR
ncbi:hypothetical protein [Flavobacterium sp.]|uniref:hypothetical protein n=1 Tax=Flavobacterium sp. TaxID=239 RepID=UPI001B75BB21|nr:hypothetical protein [Flavobacterium sp.]MBP6182968.1 hypothetical protein [Flavobacterium sp.]